MIMMVLNFNKVAVKHIYAQKNHQAASKKGVQERAYMLT